MEQFLSCDWGTSSFRLRLVETTSGGIIAEEISNRGIAEVFQMWKQSGNAGDERFSFYGNIIEQHIKSIETKLKFSSTGVPLVISGMACSTLGMIDLPYKELPFSTDGSDLVTKIVRAYDDFSHDIIFISGVKSIDDAMRGEETQLVGCFPDEAEQVFIFPGTHSKHVEVKNKKAVGITTYMTGEFFELLSEKSILSTGVEKSAGFDDEKNRKAFELGVKESLNANLLNGCFKVRTNSLFGELTPRENYHYLSGLLIGSEVKEVSGYEGDIWLVSDSLFCSYYEAAFNVLVGSSRKLRIQSAEAATVAGQLKSLKRLLK